MLEHSVSPDGTRIGYECVGDGPPLVLLHGTGGSRMRWVPLLDALLADGNRDAVVAEFLTQMVRMPPDELALSRSKPAWQGRMASAHTLPRELRAQDKFRIDPVALAKLMVPTLILVGGDSPAY